MKKILIFIIICCFVYGCSDVNKAHQILEERGYENIKTDGYDWLACGRDYIFHTKFEAILNGKKVTGTVCSGSFYNLSISHNK